MDTADKSGAKNNIEMVSGLALLLKHNHSSILLEAAPPTQATGKPAL
jgi:hypothetical protein